MTRSHPRCCQVTESELLAYRDGELTAARQTTITAHIAACPACQHRLAVAAYISETLRQGSPLIDQPVARAMIQARIAGNRAAWWRSPAVAGAVLPVVFLLFLALGVTRWAEDDACTGCPPPPAPMRVTSSAGLPVEWQLNAACHAPPISTRMPLQDGQVLPSWSRQGPASTQAMQQRVPPHTNLPVARMTTRPQPGANEGPCNGSDGTPRLGWHNGPRIGMAQSRSGPGA
jgi:anti-sigma factor RsiW